MTMATCPSCGRCPHCGHTSYPRPPYYPSFPYPSVWWNVTGFGNSDGTTPGPNTSIDMNTRTSS